MTEEMVSRIRQMEQIDLEGLTEKAKVAIEAYVKGLEMGMEINEKEADGVKDGFRIGKRQAKKKSA